MATSPQADQRTSAKAPAFSYLQEDAFHELLKKHQRKAINCLILSRLYDIDPVLGDASCEQRAPLMLDLHDQVQRYLEQNGKKHLAQDLLDQYDLAHKKDKEDTKIRTRDDFLATEHDPSEYIALFTELRDLLGVEAIEFLGLCYSLTVSCNWAFEEFGLRFYYRSKNTYRISTKEAEDQRNPKLLLKREPMLRHQLATLSLKRFINLVERLSPGGANGAVPGSTPAARPYLEQQLLETTHWMRSRITQQEPGKDDMDLVAIYPQFRAILPHELRAGRPLIMMVRRIQLNATNPAGLTYSLSDARALFFEPVAAKGTYAYVQHVSAQRAKLPAVVFDCWSTYHAGTDGVGLKAADHEQYFEALLKCDMPWLILTFTAGHPSFSSKAEEEDPDYAQIYKDICGPTVRPFTHSREGCAGFDLKPHALGDERPNLFEEWAMAKQVARDHELVDVRLVTHRDEDGPRYTRIDRAADLHVHHVNVSTFERAQTHCKELVERHCTAGKSIIGRFIVWVGGVVISCVEKSYADHLSGMSDEKKRKKDYVKEYENNQIFLKPLKSAW